MTKLESQEWTNRSLRARENEGSLADRIATPEREHLELTAQEFSDLASQIEAALVEDNMELEAMSDAIQKSMSWHLAQAPRTIGDVVRGQADADPLLQMAYSLGHLSFAHLLVEQTTSRLASDAFYEAFDDPKYAATIDALARREMTNSALAEELQVRPETVSRNLRALRELGISGFRKIGTQAINYLTPATLAFRDGSERTPVVPRQTRITLDEKVREIPHHLREQSILSD